MIKNAVIYFDEECGFCLLYEANGYEYGTEITEYEAHNYAPKYLARKHYLEMKKNETGL